MSLLGKLAKDLGKVSKTSMGDMKGISKDLGEIISKVTESMGSKGGGGKEDPETEAQMKKLLEQMKEIGALSEEIRKSMAEISKAMAKQ